MKITIRLIVEFILAVVVLKLVEYFNIFYLLGLSDKSYSYTVCIALYFTGLRTIGYQGQRWIKSNFLAEISCCIAYEKKPADAGSHPILKIGRSGKTSFDLNINAKGGWGLKYCKVQILGRKDVTMQLRNRSKYGEVYIDPQTNTYICDFSKWGFPDKSLFVKSIKCTIDVIPEYEGFSKSILSQPVLVIEKPWVPNKLMKLLVDFHTNTFEIQW